MFKSSKTTKGTNVAGGVSCSVRSALNYSWLKISTFPFVKYMDSYMLYIIYLFIYFYFSDATLMRSHCFFPAWMGHSMIPFSCASSTSSARWAVCFQALNHRREWRLGQLVCPNDVRRPLLFRCYSAAPAKLWRTVQQRISTAHHLLYAEGVFCALFAPVANQEGAVVSIRKLQLCLASLHWSCKPGQDKKGLMKENRRSRAWGQSIHY